MASTALRSNEDRGPSYEEDFAAWSFYQAMLLKAGRFHLLDRHWITEELETLGRGEFRVLRSALIRVIQHMLKWDHQPELRSRSWVRSIRIHRKHAAESLEENPSLKPRRDEALANAYDEAVIETIGETQLPVSSFPDICPYSWDEVMARPFDWPE